LCIIGSETDVNWVRIAIGGSMVERNRITPREWLHKKVSEIISLTEDNYIEDNNELLLPSYEKGPWTVLKLISLRYILSIYTNIIGSSRFFKDMIYLDLLAGPGLNKIDGKYRLLGSPFIAALTPKSFSKMIFLEKSPARAKALEKRLNNVFSDKHKFVVIPKDCNEIDEIIKLIPRRAHFFAFIDNEGFDAKWSTIEVLLGSRNGDVLITFPTTGFSRTDGFVSSEKSPSPEKADQKVIDFIKGNKWRNLSDEENLKQYTLDIKKLRNITIPIKIQRKIPKGYYYHLLYATKETEGGSPWVPGIKDLKYKIERLSGEDVDMILPVITGEQETISRWLKGTQRTIFDNFQ